MNALMLEGEKYLALRDIEEPSACSGSEIISVAAVSIGGSEYLGFSNPGIRSLPNIMGHGFSGTTASGKRVAVYPLSGCGNCCYCITDQQQLCDEWSLIGVQSDGGFTQKAVVPKKQLVKLPDDISWEQSVFIEPFANSINAWETSAAASKNTIAVVGAGSLGLGLVALAQASGCTVIHVSELSTARKKASRSLGATHTESVLPETYDIVFDTVGSTETREQAIQATSKGGTCVFLGFASAELNVNVSELIRHQKKLIGSFVYSKRQFTDAIELAKTCDSGWVKNISFKEVEGILKGFLQGDFSHVKVALRPEFS